MFNLVSAQSKSKTLVDEVVGRFEEELEINDFPQAARWRVTRKEHVAELSEFSSAAITVRGTFFPKDKRPKVGFSFSSSSMVCRS
jgi:ATP-dependent RNA helicase DDX46/PRP5